MPDKKLPNALLAILGLLVALGILIAWEAMSRYATAIAALYATAAILAAAAWLSLLLVRVAYGVRRSRREHTLDEAEAKARHIAIAAETGLTQAEAMARARILSADARKAEREADLHIITAKRDEQVFIADNDPNRTFTAGHLQPGRMNGKLITPTAKEATAWAVFHGPKSQAAAAVIQEQPITPAELPPIIPALVNRQRILIVGASDAGKTTLLRWLIDARDKCLVIDPHGSPAKWGPETMQIGHGLDYSKIAVALPQLLAEMKRRHAEIGSGAVLEGQHAQLTIIIDEFRGIVKHCKEAGKQISDLLTDGRKTQMNLIITSHSRYVKALGIEGEGDLRKGYVIVALSGGNGEPHRATLEFNADNNEIEYALPGPHPVIEEMKAKAQAAEKIETDLEAILKDMPEPEPKPTSNGFDPDQAAAIREMAANGISKPDIARKLGYDNYGGSIFYQIKQALQGA